MRLHVLISLLLLSIQIVSASEKKVEIESIKADDAYLSKGEVIHLVKATKAH